MILFLCVFTFMYIYRITLPFVHVLHAAAAVVAETGKKQQHWNVNINGKLCTMRCVRVIQNRKENNEKSNQRMCNQRESYYIILESSKSIWHRNITITYFTFSLYTTPHDKKKKKCGNRRHNLHAYSVLW